MHKVIKKVEQNLCKGLNSNIKYDNIYISLNVGVYK